MGKPPGTTDIALLSPDGLRFLTICQENPIIYDDKGRPRRNPNDNDKAAVTLWDAATGKRISDLAGHTGHINDAVFSPDGQTLLTGGADKTARLWSADNGLALGTLEGHVGAVSLVAFGPGGNLAATLAGEPGDPPNNSFRVRWWDTQRRVQIGSVLDSGGYFGSLRFLHRDVLVVQRSQDMMGSGVATYFVKGMEHGIVAATSRADGCRANDDYLLAWIPTATH